MLGALLGTQNGREVEIVNTFELAVENERDDIVDHGFLMQRRDQCKPLFLERSLLHMSSQINRFSLRWNSLGGILWRRHRLPVT